MQDIGKNLLKLREDNNLTQAEMAKRLGVSRQTISSWESGRTVPGANIIQEIRDIFDIDLLEGQRLEGFSVFKTVKKKQNMAARRWMLAATFLLSTGHLVGVFMGKLSFPSWLSCPSLFLFFHFIFHVCFGYCIRNNDYSLISGYNKEKDSDEMVAAVLNSVWLFTGLQAVICNILFFGIYFIEGSESKRLFHIVLSVVFVSFVVLIMLVSKYKYARKS